MERTLTITDKVAREAYSGAPDSLKALLESSFGSKEFFSQKITDRVKTLEDACRETGRDCEQFKAFIATLSPDTAAYESVKVIIEALNEKWNPDWDNSNERKWFPWFYMDSASGFRLYVAYYDYANTDVGSRLCLKSEELARYAATQFLPIYKDLFTL